jgi:hypothetical protein
MLYRLPEDLLASYQAPQLWRDEEAAQAHKGGHEVPKDVLRVQVRQGLRPNRERRHSPCELVHRLQDGGVEHRRQRGQLVHLPRLVRDGVMGTATVQVQSVERDSGKVGNGPRGSGGEGGLQGGGVVLVNVGAEMFKDALDLEEEDQRLSDKSSKILRWMATRRPPGSTS